MADLAEQVDQPKMTVEEASGELGTTSYLRDLGLQWNDLVGKTVLNIGTGDEAFASAAKKRGIQVVSIDTFAGGMRNTPDDSFDLIVSRTAAQSMADLQDDFGRMLNEAKRVLTPGGEFRFGPGVLEPAFQTHEEYAKRFRLIEDKVKGNERLTENEAAFWEVILKERARQEAGLFTGSDAPYQLNLLHNQKKAKEINPHLSIHAVGGSKHENALFYVLKKPEAQQAIAA